MVTETKERMKEMWDEAVEAVLEKAKDLGIRGEKEFVTLNTNADKQYGLIEISQSILDKLLKGDIRRLEQIDKLKISENRELGNKSRENPTETIKNPFVYTVLYKWQEDSTTNDQVVVVETIFLNV